jgi:hypothetical protein
MIFAHPCMQVSAKLLPLEEDPQPCTAPSAKPATRNDPITAETVFLDIARYLLLVCVKGPEGITACWRSVFRL